MVELKTLNTDCLEFMKTCDDKQFDLAIVDPPYGIGEDGGKFRDRKNGNHRILPKKIGIMNHQKKNIFQSYFE